MTLVLISSFALAQNSYANINNIKEVSIQQSKLALEAAIADVNRRLGKIKPNMRLSYVREKDDNEGTIQRYKFTPEGSSDGKWTAVNTKYSDNTADEKSWDNDALLSLNSFDIANAKLKSETEKSWLFELPTFVEINVNAEKADQKKAEEFSKVMQAELEVSKKNCNFISYRIYSLKPFKPEFMIEVTKFNIHNILNEAWANGPLVTFKQTKDVEGSMGFLISIDDHTTALYSDFKLLTIE